MFPEPSSAAERIQPASKACTASYLVIRAYVKEILGEEALDQLLLEAEMLSLFFARVRGSDGNLLSTKMH